MQTFGKRRAGLSATAGLSCYLYGVGQIKRLQISAGVKSVTCDVVSGTSSLSLAKEKSPVMQSRHLQPQTQPQPQHGSAAGRISKRREILASARSPEIADSTDVVVESKGNRKTTPAAAGRRLFPSKKKSDESSSANV